MFDYLNVRVYDDEKTNLLKHWDNTFKYITRAKKDGSKVLVHCKMGVSRSASVVIAYAMKAYNWTFSQALKHVKIKRNCIKPNKSFLSQLETYQGMLDAMKNKEKLQRSKSETNLRNVKDARLLPGSEPTPLIQALNAAEKMHLTISERELKRFGRRPKSWSPDHVEAFVLLPKQQSQSLENLTPERAKEERTNKNVRLPCSNGQHYSVSQNQVVHLQEHTADGSGSGMDDVPSVKLIVSELELNAAERRMSQFLHRNHCSGTGSGSGSSTASVAATDTFRSKKTWDPGVATTGQHAADNAATIDLGSSCINTSSYSSDSQSLVKNSSKSICDSPTWTSSAQIIHRTAITSSSLPLSSSSSSSLVTTVGMSAPYLLSSSSSSMSSSVTGNEHLLTTQPSSIVTGNQQHHQHHRENDLFSNQVDRVFDREERKQIRHRSSISSMPSTIGSTMTIEQNKGDLLVSRQSSWSSVDSAVVLTRDTPSRHSSWGSVDDSRVPPSRNSSWGSYDIKSTSTPVGYMFSASSNAENLWPSGTVKRTKSKIEKPLVGKRICGGGVNRGGILTTTTTTTTTDVPLASASILTDAISNTTTTSPSYTTTKSSSNHRAIDIITISDKRLFLQQKDKKNRCNSEETLSAETILSSLNSRLSASAPETSVIGSIAAAVKNVTKRTLKTAASIDERTVPLSSSSFASVSTAAAATTNLYGIVQNLKMNFEPNAMRKDDATVTSSIGIKVKSLPSSPIAAHPERNYNDHSFLSYKNATAATGEEINVRGLVDRYEITKTKNDSSTLSSVSSSISSSSSSSSVTTTIKPRPRSVFEPKHHHQHKIVSSAFATKPLMITHSTKIDEYRRPPVPPPIVKNALGTIPITNALKTAACKKIQQHGKTHPLARLGLPKQRLNTTAAYNTM